MNVNISAHHAGTYRVATPVYEGPLDLLLSLIERAELDITRLALAQVTDQYLAHLKALPRLAAEEVSAFLIIAVKLLQIKSEMLLPRYSAQEESEEDVGEALARQLLDYRRYRIAAENLAERQLADQHTHLRLAPTPTRTGRIDLGATTLADLVEAGRAVFGMAAKVALPASLSAIVTLPRITIREKINAIARLLHQRGRITFQSLLGRSHSRLNAMITFLAMLELIKRHLVQVQQARLFGEIELEMIAAWDESEEFEVEF